jgi:hypothetical protein
MAAVRMTTLTGSQSRRCLRPGVFACFRGEKSGETENQGEENRKLRLFLFSLCGCKQAAQSPDLRTHDWSKINFRDLIL